MLTTEGGAVKMDMEGDTIEISPGVKWGTMAVGPGAE
jgi:hypothetical protein